MKIAHMIHNIYGAGVIELLGDQGIAIPRAREDYAEWMNWPDVPVEWLGRDVTQSMRRAWPYIAEGLREAEFCYNWVRKERPDVVLLWNDEYPHNRGALTAAKELGIPTVELVHGNIHTQKIGHWVSEKHCDWVIGASWEYLDWHLMQFGNADRVIATGTVTQDPYGGAAYTPDVRKAARHELQLGPGLPVVTFLTDAVFNRTAWQDPALRYGAALDFFEAFKQMRHILPNLHLIVKVHPYESVKGQKVGATQYRDLIKAAGIATNYTIIDEPLVVAIAPADLVVGTPSSAMATAFHFGIPALVLANEPFFIDKYKNRGGMVATSPDRILPYLGNILMDEAVMNGLIQGTSRGVEYFSGAEDGKAAQRVKDALTYIARGEKPGEECWTQPETPKSGLWTPS